MLPCIALLNWNGYSSWCCVSLVTVDVLHCNCNGLTSGCGRVQHTGESRHTEGDTPHAVSDIASVSVCILVTSYLQYLEAPVPY